LQLVCGIGPRGCQILFIAFDLQEDQMIPRRVLQCALNPPEQSWSRARGGGSGGRRRCDAG
jgi:hypothetical protein